jgi:Fic family protein
MKRINDIERKGEQLYIEISKNGSYKNAFETDARAEEAIMSAIYEGANTTRKEAKKFIANKEKPKNTTQWMVLNNYEANKWINENKNLALDKNMILKIHEIVTKNTLNEEDALYCGKFRDDEVYVGNKAHKGIDKNLVEGSLNEVIDIVTKSDRYFHPLIKGILLHYFVAYVHPFFDGNGRTARTLFYFKCLKHGLEWVNFLSISADLKAPGKKYENSFKLVKENHWDLTYFILYSLESLERALDVVERKVQKLSKINLLKEVHAVSDSQIGAVQRLYLHKYGAIDVKNHSLNIEKSLEAARLELKGLEAKGFLFEFKVKNKSYYQVDKQFVDQQIEKYS